jgi:protein-S-isoprenylcysteine O-methyltransferase Ste14
MPVLALGLCLAYLAIVFGAQALIQHRRTGTTGWVSVRAKGRAERAADVLFAFALLLDLAAPILVLSGAIEPIEALDTTLAHVLGVTFLVVSAAAARAAQSTMGAAWRTGIDPAAPQTLVVDGPFSLARNPVYTTMIAASLGSALLVPSAIGAVAVVACLVALELQTRGVEEPHLRSVHGERYAEYAARVGRFVPGLGRLR